MTAPGVPDPVAALDQLGACWSPDVDAYAAGELPAAEVRCALCLGAPCQCPPFGTPAYGAALGALVCPSCGGDRFVLQLGGRASGAVECSGCGLVLDQGGAR